MSTWQFGGITLYQGNCMDVLPTLPAESVQACITSPPYWGLRNYGTATWEGGDPGCDHRQQLGGEYESSAKQNTSAGTQTIGSRDICRKCGAIRIDQQLGLERVPDCLGWATKQPCGECYVCHTVAWAREVRRVLRDDGVMFLVLGDSYTSGNRDTHGTRVGYKQQTNRGMCGENDPPRAPMPNGLKPKDLVGIPWSVAKALQAPYYTGKIRSEGDRIWLAATIDAEGTICGFRHVRKDDGNVRTGVHVQITNSCMAILEHAQNIWPSSLNEHGRPGEGHLGTVDTWRWIAHDVDEKAQLMLELYPYFIAKKKQAMLAWNLFGMSGEAKRYGRGRSGQEERDKRDWIVNALSELNHGKEIDVPSWIEEPDQKTLWEPGWWLRSDVIWAKPNPMPESVTDRPTKAHEYVFILAKSQRYYWDAEAVKEPNVSDEQLAHNKKYAKPYAAYDERAASTGQPGNVNNVGIHGRGNGIGRNLRTVWNIATQPYAGAHFAVFPEKLVEPMVKAVTSERGCCPKCGRPWRRIFERTDEPDPSYKGSQFDEGKTGINGGDRVQEGERFLKRPIGWDWSCTHGKVIKCMQCRFQLAEDEVPCPRCGCGDREILVPHDPIPCTILDPFGGSGTVASVALRLGRRAILCELNPDYIELQKERIEQTQPLLEGLLA